RSRDMHKDAVVTRRPGVAEIIGATGPNPKHRDALMLFGQFVGSWDVDATQRTPDGRSRRVRGEWHFFWVLEGREIHDVILTPRSGERVQGRCLSGINQN